MKPTGDGGWAHFACAVWQQSLRFENLTTFEPISHEWDLNSESFMRVCSVCDLCYGSTIACSVPNCKIPFHPTCGLRAGLYMFVEDSDKAKIGVKLFSFCAYHSDKARSVRNNTNNRMEFILDQLNMGNSNFSTECYKVGGIFAREFQNFKRRFLEVTARKAGVEFRPVCELAQTRGRVGIVSRSDGADLQSLAEEEVWTLWDLFIEFF